MRLVAGSVLIYRGFAGLLADPAIGPVPVLFAKIMLGTLLIAGLWTPIAASLTAFLEIGLFILKGEDPWLHLLLATLGICLALLGPGAWSVDARLFGWKRIDIRERPRDLRPPSHSNG
jgi:hypothetical protein